MKKRFTYIALAIASLLSVFPVQGAPKKNKVKAPIEAAIDYNNDGLMVDLGVGLWGIPLPMDYDGDGLKDLLVICPDRPYTGLWYFRNIGTKSAPTFDKAERLSAKGPKNVRYSEVDGVPYIMAPGVDYNDFAKDLFKTKTDLSYEGEVIGEGFVKSRSNLWNRVDWDGDGDLDIIVGIDTWDDYGWDNAYDKDGNWTRGPLHGYVYFIENVDGKYVNRGRVQADGKDMETYGAPSPCIADWDGDGDLDLISGEFVDGLTWWENVGTRTEPRFAAPRQLANANGDIRLHLEMIVPVVTDMDGDGLLDLVIGDEDGRVAWLRNTGGHDKGMPLFDDPYYFKQVADKVKFGALVTPCAWDWDGDGKQDIIAGNSAGEIAFIRNLTGGDNPTFDEPQFIKVDGSTFRIMAGENGSIQGPAERKWGYTVPTVADWDGDGHPDIIYNSIWGKIEWLRNPGSESVLDMEAPRPVMVEWEGETPRPEWQWWEPQPGTLVTEWRTTPIITDWNKDGLQDLIVLDCEGYLSYFERFVNPDGTLSLKPGERIFHGSNCSVYDPKKGVTNAEPGLLRLNEIKAGWGGRRKMCLVDMDNDGRQDIVIDSTSAAWFRNVEDRDGHTWFEYMGNLTPWELAGHSTCPTPINWRADGQTEILLGAEDGRLYRINPKLINL